MRKNAGICDVSTLGKIEIFGKDAAEFLNRVYCNAFLKLPVGKARYGLMLREDGLIYDDGTTSRLGENHFFMTTTTALAAGVMNHLEFCAQALWPDLDVQLASATDQWAQMAVAGPKARTILQALVDDDISDAAFPFLGAQEVSLFGGTLTGRLFRISFSGELAYELAVPAGYGEAVADAIMAAGAAHGIAPYGVEALGVMRIEKGHVTHAEINGTVIPADLGFGRRWCRRQSRTSSARRCWRAKGMDGAGPPDTGRRQAARPRNQLQTGSHILSKGAHPVAGKRSGLCDLQLLLAAISARRSAWRWSSTARARHGEDVTVWNDLRNEYTQAVLCSPVFFDPENEKLHG